METRFVKNYKDVILVYDYDADYVLLLAHGYEPDEEGAIELEMVFGDGIAYDTQMNGIVMRYPTLYEVAQSAELQHKVWQSTCRDEIIPYDIAMACGKVGQFKYVYDYNEWYGDEDCDPTARQEVWTLYVRKGKDDSGHIAFDVFDDEYMEMEKAGLIAHSETEDGHYLEGYPSKDEVAVMAAKYGILWTEWIGNHVFDNRGYLVEYVEKELTYKERVKLMADRIAAFGGTMVIWNDKEFHFAFESGWRYRTAHGEMWIKEVKSNDIIVTDGEKNWEIPTWILDEKFMYQLYMTFVKVCERNLTEIAYKKVMLAIGEE